MFILNREERNRRWAKVREVMEQRRLESLIVYGVTGRWLQLAANLRYLANVAIDGYLVFPLKDDPMLIWFVPRPDETAWVTDNRAGHPRYSNVISNRLKELHLENARIGLVGLSRNEAEFGFPHATYMSLGDNFPRAVFEDATDIIAVARRIKSPPEIRCFELGCEIGEKVIQAVVDTARPGVRDFEVKAKMMETLYREGCDQYSMLLYHSGKEITHGGQGGYHKPRVLRALEDGDIILTEFDANYCGYIAQYNQPFSVGEPTGEWVEMMSVAVEAFYLGVDTLSPGITAGELDEALLSPIRKAGYTYTNPAFHGLGLGIEEPFGSFPLQPEHKFNRSVIMQPGMVLEIEPHLTKPDFKKGLIIGSPVLVTETGCRLLSKNWRPELRVA